MIPSSAPHLAASSSKSASAHAGAEGGAESLCSAPPIQYYREGLEIERQRDISRARVDETGDRTALSRAIEIENTRALVDQVIANAKARRKLRVGQHRAWRERVDQRAAAMRARMSAERGGELPMTAPIYAGVGGHGDPLGSVGTERDATSLMAGFLGHRYPGIAAGNADKQSPGINLVAPTLAGSIPARQQTKKAITWRAAR